MSDHLVNAFLEFQNLRNQQLLVRSVNVNLTIIANVFGKGQVKRRAKLHVILNRVFLRSFLCLHKL